MCVFNITYANIFVFWIQDFILFQGFQDKPKYTIELKGNESTMCAFLSNFWFQLLKCYDRYTNFVNTKLNLN